MNRLHRHTIHSAGGAIERFWCSHHWSECPGECSLAEPGTDLDETGTNRLICRLVSLAIESAQNGHREQIEVAFHWSVIGGLEPHAAAHAIMAATQGNRALALRRIRHAQREADRLAQYTQGNRCPFCGVLITNTARACKRHARAER